MKNPKIEIWNAENINIEYKHIGLKGSPTQVVKTFIPKSKVAAETIEGPTNNQVKTNFYFK